MKEICVLVRVQQNDAGPYPIGDTARPARQETSASLSLKEVRRDVPLSRLESQAAISLFPCSHSAGSSAILRPSVRTDAISGRVEVVRHPDSRSNPAMKQYTRLRCRTNSPGTLLRPMIRTPGRTWRQTAKSSPARHTRLPRRFEVVAQAEMCAWTNSTCP